MTKISVSDLTDQLVHLLDQIYTDVPSVKNYEQLAVKIFSIIFPGATTVNNPGQHENLWDQNDVVMISYGDSIIAGAEAGLSERPLRLLKKFLDERCNGVINTVHILPFFPFSSDDGFSVIDYSTVNESLGDWFDIKAISKEYRLMSDLVINHCSSRGYWFDNFIKGEGVGHDFFFTASPGDNLDDVVRPRSTPLLRHVVTAKGDQYVWCTFSHDQVDLDFTNINVLLEFIKIIRLYLDMGIRIFRLDAIAFLWKKSGTPSINLDETHAVVRLLRLLIEHAEADAVIITETNIPNRENLSYFGNANEAHWVYNFSLPPLLVNTLVSGNCHALKLWLMSMPQSQMGTAYFNFIASHDGIGLRPLEGILSEEKTTQLINTMQKFGGKVSWRALTGGEQKPYEINISLYDALKGSFAGEDHHGLDRFVCAHAIMLALQGVPAIYIHSLLGSRNDNQRMQASGHNRCINRHQWTQQELDSVLDDENSSHAMVFKRLKRLIAIRQEQPAFHPNASQHVLHLGDKLFGFWRSSVEGSQSIFCVANISRTNQSFHIADLNLNTPEHWADLLTMQSFETSSDNYELAPYQVLWVSNWVKPEHFAV